jgi:hypothetical protein
VEDEWQIMMIPVADVSTDEILAKNNSADVTLLLFLYTIMMNNAESKRESKKKIETQIYVVTPR